MPRVELGALVMCSSFRNAGLHGQDGGDPRRPVRRAGSILGLGCGWHEPEYDAFGYPFDHLVGRFEEDLEVITRLLRGEEVTSEGRWSQYDHAKLLPPPARRTPTLVASKGERMLRLTAQWSDAWNTAWFGEVDDVLRERLRALNEACAAVGRDPATIRRTIGIRVREPGRRRDAGKSTDADAAGLADLFDELESVGCRRRADLVARRRRPPPSSASPRRGASTSPGADPQPGNDPPRTIAVP